MSEVDRIFRELRSFASRVEDGPPVRHRISKSKGRRRKRSLKAWTYDAMDMNMNEMKTMIRDVIRDTVRDVIREELQEAGILSESTENANEVIQFKVGKHIFMGKVTKIQKLK